nr:alpha/beta hydrolase-fold protein [uncultured Undibacterium sp.]
MLSFQADAQGVGNADKTDANKKDTIPEMIVTATRTEIGDQAVGIHVGGVYSPPPQGSQALMFDLKQVEGLSSAQGTYASNEPAVTLGQRHTLHSARLNEDRELLIALPANYADEPGTAYPLFVVLDGEANFGFTATTLDVLSRGGAVPKMIVVGVVNTNRWRDLTPIPEPGIPNSGGGPGFQSFLADELLPWLEQHYRLSGFRVISGHSLGGVTAISILHKAPSLFDAYLALSPSLEAGEGYLVPEIEKQFKYSGGLDKMLYLSLADEQGSRPYFERLESLLSFNAPADLQWVAERFGENDDHMSSRVSSGLSGIRWLFRDWRLTAAQGFRMSDPERQRWAARASRRYKQLRDWGEQDMTNAAYWGLEHNPVRALQLFREATKRWPDSYYALSCLGEGLQRTGDVKAALVLFERALTMARTDKSDQVPYFEGLLENARREIDVGKP